MDEAKKTFTNDSFSEAIIGRALEVHRQLGPGLLESTYEECLCIELREHGFAVRRQVNVPISYKGKQIAAIYRLDLVVAERIVIEIKAVEKFAPVHEAQLLTYMKHTSIPTGLLFNFNVPLLRDGIRRLSL
jgi:GxxExxY protein